MNAPKTTPEERAALETQAAVLMDKARTQLILAAPFYGQLSMKLPLRPKWDLPHHTAGTDGRRLYYDPGYISKQTVTRLMGLIAHECLHCIWKHSQRRGTRDRLQWNIAADYSINPLITDDKTLTLPEGALIEPDYAGMTDAEIYDRLKIAPPPQPPTNPGQGKGQGKGKGKTDQTPEDEEDAPQEDPEDEPAEEDAEEDESPAERKPGAEKDPPEDEDGTPGDDMDDPEEEDEDEPDKDELTPEDIPEELGDILDDPGPDPKDPDASGLDLADALNARQFAQARGNMPERLDAALTAAIHPTYSLTDIIREFIQDSVKADYSWRRPNKAYRAHGLYAPSLQTPSPESIAVFMDVSGSISLDQLATALDAVQGAAEDLALPVILVTCNERVQYYHKAEPGEDIQVPKTTGGGTDFNPPFERLEEEGETPTCAIYLSADLDGCFPEPQDAPPYPVAWISEPREWHDYATGKTLTSPPDLPFGTNYPVLKPERQDGRR